jgi:hypothetical protein
MAGSVIISKENVWIIASRIFHPLMEIVKTAYRIIGATESEVENQFSSIDAGFEYIAITDNSSFNLFVIACTNIKQNPCDYCTDCLNQEALSKCIDDLFAHLNIDPRFASDRSVQKP